MARYDDDDYDDRPASRRRRYDDEEEDDRPRRRRYEDDEGEYDFRKRDLPHSGIGIVSLVIAVCAGIALLVLFATVGVMAEEAGGDLDENSPAVAFLGVLVLAGLGVTLLGLGLGVAGVFRKDRNKLFGTLGLIANALVFLGSVLCAISSHSNAENRRENEGSEQ